MPTRPHADGSASDFDYAMIGTTQSRYRYAGARIGEPRRAQTERRPFERRPGTSDTEIYAARLRSTARCDWWCRAVRRLSGHTTVASQEVVDGEFVLYLQVGTVSV